jgi:hypothetical protein
VNVKPHKIEVRAARTQKAVLDHECDLVIDSFDTIHEAKAKARYVLTDDYQRVSESHEPMRYSQVVVDGQCHSDFFRKGYNGEDVQ